jgi:Periplasmic binding protein domain
VIEANAGEVVFEEYYPIDQAEYSATVGKIRDGKVDCVLNTTIPPGLQSFTKQLFESGFQKNGGLLR